MKGFFGSTFDFNGDRKLDGFERTAAYISFNNMTVEANIDNETKAELENDLEYMDEDEINETLEDADLDPDD